MIIGMAGRKQSGKSTCCNFIHGHEMKLAGVIEEFNITDLGELMVNCHYEQDGKTIKDMGVLDLNQKNDIFFDYAANRIWPLVKGYSFAEPLKELCCSLFELPYEACYGTDAQKNAKTNINWKNVPGVLTKDKAIDILSKHEKHAYLCSIEDLQDSFGPSLLIKEAGLMTGREIMQYVGTNIFRRMYDKVWINATLNMIRTEQSPISLISDVRFCNEVDAIKDAGGKVIHLTRKVYQDSHASENDLDNYQGFDLVIDNQNLSIKECNTILLDALVSWGVTKRIYVPVQGERFTSVKR